MSKRIINNATANGEKEHRTALCTFGIQGKDIVLNHWYGRIVAWYAHTASGKSCIHFETKLPGDSLFGVCGTLLLLHAHDLMKASASW